MQNHTTHIITNQNTEHLQPYFKQYGDSCMSYSGLQDGLEYFYIEGIGYIAYLNYKHFLYAPRGIRIALANPVCSKKDVSYLLEQFIATFPHVIFIQISREVAQTLDALGHRINQFGIETELAIPSYDLKGKHKSSLRQWKNKCVREQVEVEEIDLSQCNIIPEIESLSETWLRNKGGKQLSFINRPFLYQDEEDTRCFIAKQHNKLIGISVFDPLYRDNKVIGYYHNVDRIVDEAPHGVSPYLILRAMEAFKKEQVEILSLGMSPLYSLGKEFNYNKVSRKLLRYSYNNMNFLYPFQGNTNHKKKFAGEQKRVYFCSTKGNRVWDIFLLMKAIRIF